nr:prepilin peptidase [Motilimonas cestriensis]
MLAWIAYKDLKNRIIPNKVSLLLLLVVVVTVPFQIQYLLLAFVTLVVGIVLFHYRILGAGDSKLLGILAYAAQENVGWFFVVTGLIGGAVSLLLLLCNQLNARQAIIIRPVNSVPYAIAISLGAFFTVPYLKL